MKKNILLKTDSKRIQNGLNGIRKRKREREKVIPGVEPGFDQSLKQQQMFDK
jgi:hypothetical protein